MFLSFSFTQRAAGHFKIVRNFGMFKQAIVIGKKFPTKVALVVKNAIVLPIVLHQIGRFCAAKRTKGTLS